MKSPAPLFLLLLLLATTNVSWADTSTSGTGTSNSSEQGNNGTTLEQPATPVVEPGGQVKPADRQKSTAMAKAMALGGMAQSMVMCMQMMQEAQKQENSSDKALMMMMAQQACQQGNEMAKAAAEADKGQKAVSQEDIPKQSQLKMTAQKLPSGSAKEDTSALSGYKIISDEEATKSEDVSALKPMVPALDQGEGKKVVAAAVAEATPEPEAPMAPNLPKSVPSLIPGARTTMSDEEKNLNAGSSLPMGPNLAGLGPALAASGKSPAEEAKNLKGDAKADGAEARSEKATAAMEVGEGGGGGGGASGEKANDPFEAMLAQLMGGPPEGESGPGSSEDIVMAPRGEGKTPNLFEYASFRYGKLVDQHKLKGGKPEAMPTAKGLPTRPAPAERAPASQAKLSKR